MLAVFKGVEIDPFKPFDFEGVGRFKMNKDPVYQWFMVECGTKPQGGFELCFRFDNYEEAMKKADEMFKSGYGIINIYIRGTYGRESIPMSEW